MDALRHNNVTEEEMKEDNLNRRTLNFRSKLALRISEVRYMLLFGVCEALVTYKLNGRLAQPLWLNGGALERGI